VLWARCDSRGTADAHEIGAIDDVEARINSSDASIGSGFSAETTRTRTLSLASGATLRPVD
jgi:hypothetical protein